MLDILKGKEPTDNILVICHGVQESFYLFKKVAEIYKSIYPEANCHRQLRTIYLYKTPFRMRFVGRNEADRASIGFHGKIIYGYQVERFLEELNTTVKKEAMEG